MKGRNLLDIVGELTHIAETAKDYKVHPGSLVMDEQGKVEIGRDKQYAETVKPTSWAHQQIASFLDIPKAYYDRMLIENPQLLAENVNTWLHEKGPDDRRMLRTVDGKLRGFLSPRYRRMDSLDLLNVVAPILNENKFQIVSCEHTDMRLYIKATLPKLQKDVSGDPKVNDIIQSGVIVSTSDVGAGSLRIEPYILRLVCTNGLIAESAIKKYHVGREVGGDALMEVLSDEALAADDAALWLKVRDVLNESVKPETFNKQCAKIMEAVEDKITNYDLVEVVKRASAKVGVSSKLIRENIVKALGSGNEGAGLTRWGLINSFTAAAKDAGLGYDESTDLERAGGAILNLSRTEWKNIGTA